MNDEVIQTIDSIQLSLNAGGMNTNHIILAVVIYGGMLVITAWRGIWHIISVLTVTTIFNHLRRNA